METQPTITPQEVAEIMKSRDTFSQWLGLELDEVRGGHCKLHYTVRENMLNGFGTAHGGILFAASDSAFGFACNSHGRLTVALDVSISFTRPAVPGDKLFVEATEVHLGHKVGVYDIRTTNEQGELVALFKGTAYRTSKPIA